MSEFRIERDSMGELKIPQSALYVAQKLLNGLMPRTTNYRRRTRIASPDIS